MPMFGSINLSFDESRVATIVIDVKGKSVNTLTSVLWDDLDLAIAEVEKASSNGLIIASGKPDTFIAGADLHELSALSSEELRDHLRKGQQILNRIVALKCPTVAAINGHALGGGLEVALACRHRVATGSGKFIGLPETTLGLIPGWGGTQRLPRLTGLTPALELLIEGKSISVAQAVELGVVDRSCATNELMSESRQMLREVARAEVMPDERDRFVFERFFQIARSGTNRHQPAIMRAIDVARIGWEQGIDAGLGAEIAALTELRDGAVGQHLLRNFFLKTSARSLAGRDLPGTPRDVKRVAIIGGGTMGVGIAHAMVRGGKVHVNVIETDDALAAAARARIERLLSDDLAAGRLSSEALIAATEHLRVASVLELVHDADVIIEAVVERLDVKQKLFANLDSLALPTAIIGSNTSSLSITQMANATRDASRFVGLHFFNPVPRMALVEVVAHAQLSADALQTAISVVRKLAGKTAVLVNDGPGFIVNRVLMPYLSEGVRLFEEGYSATSIDAALVDWGMPVGPLALIDTIGADVTQLIFESLTSALGQRVYSRSMTLPLLISAKELGRKSGRGIYAYPTQRGENPRESERFALHQDNVSPDEATLRCVGAMVNEALHVLEDGIAPSIEAMDIATLLGMGFPAFRGGLGSYARELGFDEMLAMMNDLHSRFGNRFEPAAALKQHAGKSELLDVLVRPLP